MIVKSKAEKMKQCILAHGHGCAIVGGKLRCVGVEVDSKLPLGHPERVIDVVTVLPLSWSAVRDWLGY